MAETTDRHTDEAVAASLPAAPPLPAATDEAPKVYSSVSVVAVVGFILAVIYAGAVGLGALVALFNHTPWLLPSWTLLFPLVAAAVCWAARIQIRKSEGALTGARLTMWGVGLSAVVGLLYAAYYGGCYAAVSSQATTFGNQWMDLLKADKPDQLDKAFLYTLPPPRPAEDSGLRDRLEMDFDHGGGGRPGMLTSFVQSQIVRQLSEGSGQSQIQCLGVQGWGYDKGSYTVDLRYRVTSAEMTSEIMITAVGVDDENGERQWYVKDPRTVTAPVFTAEGERMQKRTDQARLFGEAWLRQVEAGQWDDAYLGTLPPDERERLKKERGPSLEQGRKEFQKGGVVHYDPEAFWVGPHDKDPMRDKMRQDEQGRIAALVKGLFDPAQAKQAPPMELSRAIPVYHRDGDAVRAGFDLEMSGADMVLEARLNLTADAGRGELSRDQWRVESIELTSKKSAAALDPRMGRPGGPAPKQ